MFMLPYNLEKKTELLSIVVDEKKQYFLA